MMESSMNDATASASSISAGAIFAGVMLAFFLIAYLIVQIIGARPIDHVDDHCVYYADQRAPVVVCKVDSQP